VLASVERPTYLDTLLAERMASAAWSLKRVSRYQETEFGRANNGSPVFGLPSGTELDKIVNTTPTGAGSSFWPSTSWKPGRSGAAVRPRPWPGWTWRDCPSTSRCSCRWAAW